MCSIPNSRTMDLASVTSTIVERSEYSDGNKRYSAAFDYLNNNTTLYPIGSFLEYIANELAGWDLSAACMFNGRCIDLQLTVGARKHWSTRKQILDSSRLITYVFPKTCGPLRSLCLTLGLYQRDSKCRYQLMTFMQTIEKRLKVHRYMYQIKCSIANGK